MTLRPRVAALLLALLLAPLAAAPLPAAAEGLGDQLRRLVTELDASPDWIAGFASLTEDTGAGRTVVDGLALRAERGGLALSVDRLTVDGFDGRLDGGFTLRSATADHAALSVGPLDFAATETRLDALALPSLAGFAVDPASPFASLVRIWSLAAAARLDKATVGEFALLQKKNGTTSDIRYRNVVLSGLAGGRLEAFGAGPVAMVAPSPEGLARIDIAAIESRGTDLDAALAVLDAGRYQGGRGDAKWRVAQAFLRYRDLSATAPGVRLAIGDITLENYALRQSRRSFALLMERSLASPPMTEDESAALLRAHGLDLASSIAFGRLQVRDLDLSATGFDRFRIGTFALRDASLDGIGEIGLADIRVAVVDQGSIALGRFAIGDIVMPRQDVLATAVDAGATDADVDRTSLLPKIGYVDLQGLEIRDSARILAGLERLRLDFGHYVGPVPGSTTMALSGLDIPASMVQVPRLGGILESLGHERVVLDQTARLDWRETDQQLRISDFRLAARGLATVSADVELAGVTRPMLEQPKELPARLSTIHFNRADVRVEDKALTGPLLDLYAAKVKAPPEQFRKQIAGTLPLFLSVLKNSAFQKQLVPVLQKFIAAPGLLTVSARPASPVPLVALMTTAAASPQKLPDLLSLELKNGD